MGGSLDFSEKSRKLMEPEQECEKGQQQQMRSQSNGARSCRDLWDIFNTAISTWSEIFAHGK